MLLQFQRALASEVLAHHVGHLGQEVFRRVHGFGLCFRVRFGEKRHRRKHANVGITLPVVGSDVAAHDSNDACRKAILRLDGLTEALGFLLRTRRIEDGHVSGVTRGLERHIESRHDSGLSAFRRFNYLTA
jgi:hypothetical protein